MDYAEGVLRGLGVEPENMGNPDARFIGRHPRKETNASRGDQATGLAFHTGARHTPNRATLSLSRAKWRTDEKGRVNQDNHPIRASYISGSHNGPIYSADHLFHRL